MTGLSFLAFPAEEPRPRGPDFCFDVSSSLLVSVNSVNNLFNKSVVLASRVLGMAFCIASKPRAQVEGWPKQPDPGRAVLEGLGLSLLRRTTASPPSPSGRMRSTGVVLRGEVRVRAPFLPTGCAFFRACSSLNGLFVPVHT